LLRIVGNTLRTEEGGMETRKRGERKKRTIAGGESVSRRAGRKGVFDDRLATRDVTF